MEERDCVVVLLWMCCNFIIIKYSSNVIIILTIIIVIKKTQYVYRTSVSIFYKRRVLTCLTFREDQYVFRKIGFDFTLEIDQF